MIDAILTRRVARAVAVAAVVTGLAAVGCGGASEPAEGEAEITLEPIPGVARVNEYTRQLYAGELDALYARFTDDFRATFSREELDGLYEVLRERFGREVALVSLQRKQSGAYRAFARFATFDRYDGVVQIRWILRDDDAIAGLTLEASPQRPAPADDGG